MDREVIIDRGGASSAPAVMAVVLVALAIVLGYFYFEGDRDVINIQTPQVQTDAGAALNTGNTAGQ